MSTRLAAILCLLIVGLALGGCSKCGWLWDDYMGPKSCRGAAPTN